MTRPQSSLRQDYRPSARPAQSRPSNRLPWFTVGVLMAVALAALWRFSTTPASETAQVADQANDNGATPTSVEMSSAIGNPWPSNSDDEPQSAGSVASVDTTPNVVSAVEAQAPTHNFQRINLTIKSGDTLDGLFRKHGIAAGDLVMITRQPLAKEQLRLLRPGDTVTIDHDGGRVVSLTKPAGIDSELRVGLNADGAYVAEMATLPMETREAMRYGIIESSLFESAATAGLDDNMIMNLAGIFAWDIDFVLDIRSGDEYYLLFEEHWRNGKKIGDGEIVAAEFINNGRRVQAFRHIDDNGRSDYFAPDGRSVRKAFIRAPVDFRRISSNFNPNRRHPILNTIRAHRGVDYSAPKGTPIKAAGDGKVIFRGRKNGYGNTVILQHGGNITTLYAHLSNFARSAPISSRVEQGQVIGFVGATGLATAAHLHYEYRVNGVHRNPRTVKLPAAEPINARYAEEFQATVEDATRRLEKYKQTRLALLD